MTSLTNKQQRAKELINENKSLSELLLEAATEIKRNREPLEVMGKKCYLLYPTVANIYSYLALDKEGISEEKKLKGQIYILQDMLVNPDNTKVISDGDIEVFTKARSQVILKLLEYMQVMITAFYTFKLEEPNYDIKTTGEEGYSILKNYQALLNLDME